MTAPTRSGRPASSVPAGCLEVCTVSSDTLRAAIVVDGTVSERTAPLLLSVLGTHVRAGRRYLRVDLGAASLDDAAVLRLLLDAHTSLAELGGMLVFDNTDDRLADLLRDTDLHVSPRA